MLHCHLVRHVGDPFVRDAVTGDYPTPTLELHFNTPVWHEGFLYAFSGRNVGKSTTLLAGLLYTFKF